MRKKNTRKRNERNSSSSNSNINKTKFNITKSRDDMHVLTEEYGSMHRGHV